VVVPIHPTLRDILHETAAGDRREYVLPETDALYTHRTDAVTDTIQQHFKACCIRVWKTDTGPQPKGVAGAEAGEARQVVAGSKGKKRHRAEAKRKRAVIEVGFHSLRHTFVLLCRERNAPLAVVESIVGHSNPAMTRHYTHVGELAASQAVAALPSVMGEGEPEGGRPKVEKAWRRRCRRCLES